MIAAAIDRRLFLGGAISTSLLANMRVHAKPARPHRPAYLNAHAAAHDSRRNATLIFGGADERQVLNSLWRYSDRGWQLLSRSGPAPRTFAALAYDSHRDRLILFGGNSVLFGSGGDTLLDDHWEWNGRTWGRFNGPCPPGRSEASCAFDAARGKLIVFGGWRFDRGERVRLDDLWEFDGNAWARSSALGPERRSGAAMSYDSGHRRLLLAGGNGPKNDLWALDANGWSRLPDLPQPRFNPAIAFDRSHNQALLFGGWTGKDRLAATALFDGKIWHPYSGQEPSPRNHTVLVPSGDGSRLLLVGGHNGDDVFGDVWEWSGHWRNLYSTPPKPRVPNDH